MGTATLTRSQSRKTRSTFSSEAADRGLSSPFAVLPGNHLDPSSRRSTRRPPNVSGSSPFVVLPGNQLDSSSRRSTRRSPNISSSVEKENAPPCQNGQSYPSSERKRVIKQNTVKKRKQSACKAVDSESDILKIPVTVEYEERTNASQDLQVAEHVSRSETCAGVKLHSADRPSVEPTSAELHSRVPNDDSNATRAMSDDSKEVPSKQAGNDQNAGVLLPSTSALALVLKDYDKLFSKYKKLKARRFDEVEDLYNEQNSRITDFVQATQALIDFYKGEYESSRQQIQDANIPELLKRCKGLEKANVECRNDLLQEQSNSLELRQENKRLKSLLLEHIADKKKHSESVPVPIQGSQSGFSVDLNTNERGASALSDQSKLAQKLLECVLGLQLSYSGDGVDARLHFQHGPTGFSFNLKEVQDAEIADLVGGGALMYQNVSTGACKRAVDWMKEKEVIFGMDQAQLLFKKLTGFLNTGFYGR